MPRGDPTTQRVLTEVVDRVIDGRYRIKKALGRGGMARVYLVDDTSTGREVALKQLGGPSADQTRESHRLRFRREFHTMAGLSHPRIVEVYSFGEDALGPYYTMEHLDGTDLRDARPLPWEEASGLLRDVALGLAFLHARGLVHRDLAPRNVRCTSDARAKLIDFGVLATVGVVGDPAGTPPFIAPENLRNIPIDHRADLFGLGALAYWLFTGKTAFAARKLTDLEKVWQRRPPTPSELAPDLPKEIDELVMALISIGARGRPSAAEVIDTLTTAAGLPPPSDEEEVRAHLASAAMVGREEEIARVRRAIERAAEDRGAVFVVSAPSGMGKSRLLRELGLEAQVGGATLLHASGHTSDTGPYGLLRELGHAMLVAAPKEAAEAARPNARVIVRAIPELSEHLGPVPVVNPGRDPGEQRMLLQAELCEWFLRFSEKRTLVLSIDDLQRVDEASAAVLASLSHSARDARLVIVAGYRTDEEVRAPAPVAALSSVAHRMRLRGLDVADLERLVTTMFGRVANVRRLADYLHRGGGGSPLHSVEMLKGLIESGAIAPFHGSWVITDAWDEQSIPKGLADMLDRRVARLRRTSRTLAEMLAVHGSEIELARCVALSEVGEEGVFQGLDELAEAEVVVGTRERVRFRHDGFREAVLRGVDEERKRELHRRIGRALMNDEEALAESMAEVGWHLLRGGDEEEGAELLLDAGRQLYLSQSFSEARRPLEAVLEVFERDESRWRQTAEIRQMLLLSGCMTDRNVALRHADRAIDGLYELSGLALADRAKKRLGRVLGLAFGVGVSCVKWLFRRSPRGPHPIWALENIFLSVGFAASLHSLSWNIPALRRILPIVEPLRVFGNSNPYAVYLLTQNLLNFPLGLFRTIRENTQKIMDILQSNTLSRWHLTPINELDLRTGEAGARFMRALIDVSEQNPAYVDEVREMDKLDLRFFELGALQARIAFHRCRGEEPLATEHERTAEILLVRLGSAWQMEAWLAVVSSFAYGLTRDALGLKRSIARLEALVDDGFCFEAALALTRGEYLRERRELDASEEALRRALEFAGEDLRLARLPALAALAETLLAKGSIDEAEKIANRAVLEASDPESGQPVNRLRALRCLALAEAERGQLSVAATRLEHAIEEATPMGSPSVLGPLHEARAFVAEKADDPVALRWHASQTSRWYHPTDNQVLVARAERLEARVARRDSEAPPEARPAAEAMTVVDVLTPATAPERSELLSGCRGADERAEHALALLVESARAERGFLYLLRGDTLELEAPRVGREPPLEVAERLGVLVEAELLGEHVTVPDSFNSIGTETPTRFEAVILKARIAGRRFVIGAAAMVGDGVRPPAQPLVVSLSREIYEAGDVSFGSGIEVAR